MLCESLGGAKLPLKAREFNQGVEGKGNQAAGRASRAGSLGERESVPVPGSGQIIKLERSDHKRLTGQAEELELHSAGGREPRAVLNGARRAWLEWRVEGRWRETEDRDPGGSL